MIKSSDNSLKFASFFLAISDPLVLAMSLVIVVVVCLAVVYMLIHFSV